MNPIIALTSAMDDERQSLLHAYAEAIECAGGVPIVIPYINDTKKLEQIVNICDGIVFTGGADVSPSFYGEIESEMCGKEEPKRDEIEISLVILALKAKKPILAICRGAQLINVAFGGTLYQDIPSEYETSISHIQAEARTEYSHSVKIEKGTPLFDLVGCEHMRANSFHHQAIKVLGKGLIPMAYAPDGIVEAVYLESYPYLRAYQWHPERICSKDEHNMGIFKDFIKTAQGENK
jgi:putative glutamine amidotransferase